jgi:hypothetical protein
MPLDPGRPWDEQNESMEGFMKKQTIVIALLLLIAVFGLPAAANYNFDGFPLTTSSSGTVYGGVYTGVGDNDGQTFTSATVNHTSNYTLPDGIDVKWARLYVDAWCGTEFYNGTVNVSFNGGPWQSEFYNGDQDNNPNCWGSGHGVLWVWFDQTNNVRSGINRVDVKSTIYNNRVFRAVLVCAYNDTDGCGPLVNYWVNDGNYNLHYDGGGIPYPTDNTTTWFNGTAYNATVGLDDVCCAKLTTVYHASGGGLNGQASEPDYLYFNVIPTRKDHAPYYHHPNQLGDDGDTTYGDDDYADGPQWTMKTERVKPLLSPTNNNATFWRGHNASNGPIYHHDTCTIPDGAEGEAYLHPMLAVLVVDPGTYATMSMVGGGVDNYFGLPLMDSEPVTTALASIAAAPGVPVFVLRYNSTSSPPAFETCMFMNGAAAGQFTMLDPVRGYIAKQSAAKTLVWTSK